MEKRLLWHPRHLNRFIVAGGSQITLYECAPSQPEIRHITSQNDLNLMKCFTWSPEPLFDDLLAIGHTNGRVDLIRLEGSRFTGPDNVLSNGPVVSLPVKNQRPCNTLAFSGKDPNYLAVGLDKVRGDASLVIWDINTALPVLSFGSATSNSTYTESASNAVNVVNHTLYNRPPPTIPRAEHGVKLDSRMLQVHATTEYVSSLAFLPDSSHLLMAGISSRWLRLFDLRAPSPSSNNHGTGGGAIANVASKVHGVVTDPFDSHRVASWGDGVVSIWDTRNLGGGPQLTFTERDGTADGGVLLSTQLTTSASTTSLASLPRKGGGLMSSTAPERSPPPYTSLEFSANRRGRLATLGKDASYVRLWDILEASVSSAWSYSQTDVTSHASAGDLISGAEGKGSLSRGRLLRDRENSIGRDPLPGARKQTLSLSKRSWANFPSWGGRAPSPSIDRERSGDSATVSKSFVLSDTRRTYPLLPVSASQYHLIQPRTLTSFALVPNASFYDRHQPNTSMKVVLITSGGELALQTLHDSPNAEAAWGARGQIGGIGYPMDEQDPHDEAASEHIDPTSTHTQSNLKSFGSKSKSHSQSKSSDMGESRRGRSLGPASYFSMEPIRRLQSESKEAPSSKSRAPGPGVERGRQQVKVTEPKPTTSGPNVRLDPIQRLVGDDISSIMRRRAKRGYSFGNVLLNASLARDWTDEPEAQSLSSLWTWLHHTQSHLHAPTPHVQGYDFTYQGLWAIWTGIPKEGQDVSTPPYSHKPGHNSPMESISADATPVHRNNADLPPLLLESTLLGEPLGKRSGKHGSKWKKRHSQSKGSGNASTPSPAPTPSREGTWQAALQEVAARFSTLATVKVHTPKLLQRQVCLGLLGWGNEALVGFDPGSVRRSGGGGGGGAELSRVACWLVFFGQWERAVELLIASDDEIHHMVSATITALAPAAFPSDTLLSSVEPLPSPLSTHYSRLGAKVKDPYLWAMLTYLTTRDVSSIIGIGIDAESSSKRPAKIAFRERLALAFVFLDDWSLTSYLRQCNYRINDMEPDDASLDLLAVTGLASPKGRDVLSRWVDRTADVQSAALLGWMGITCSPHFSQPIMSRTDSSNSANTKKGKAARARREDKKRVERWVENYRDLLDAWQMFHERVEFDIERGAIGRGQRAMAVGLGGSSVLLGAGVGKIEWPTIPRQIIIRCNYCNKPITPLPNMQGDMPLRKGRDNVRNAELMGRDGVNQLGGFIELK
ncbi:hypothetical protein PQX77_004563 [Marasmius sp. AFHP31]|nr:hypothetical protein PQX77_004563 [Marasmius sp. AFHP31]